MLFANEVIDALPTPRFSLRDGEVFEEHVALDGEGRFVRVDRPADALLAAAVRHVERQLDAPFVDGYRSELLPQLPYWMQAVIGGLQRGAMLFVDYGHPRREYYQPQRSDGTLRAFRRHQLVDDVFALPGVAGPHRVGRFHRAGRSRHPAPASISAATARRPVS